MYLCKTELSELELFICIKIDLVLNNPQRLICHKTQTSYLVYTKIDTLILIILLNTDLEIYFYFLILILFFYQTKMYVSGTMFSIQRFFI